VGCSAPPALGVADAGTANATKAAAAAAHATQRAGLDTLISPPMLTRESGGRLPRVAYYT